MIHKGYTPLVMHNIWKILKIFSISCTNLTQKCIRFDSPRGVGFGCVFAVVMLDRSNYYYFSKDNKVVYKVVSEHHTSNAYLLCMSLSIW